MDYVGFVVNLLAFVRVHLANDVLGDHVLVTLELHLEIAAVLARVPKAAVGLVELTETLALRIPLLLVVVGEFVALE